MPSEAASPVLVIFARAPAPGRTKTRLMPHLTAEQCALLQDAFIHDAVDKFSALPGLKVVIGITPDDSAGYFRKFGLDLIPQGQGDLGSRMFRCLDRALSDGARRAVLTGTDIPHLSPGRIQDAINALEGSDMVFGPAEDGGFYLVGTRRGVVRGVFENISWSTAETLLQAELRAKDCGFSTARIGADFDVDSIGDLKRLPRESLGENTLRLLDELAVID